GVDERAGTRRVVPHLKRGVEVEDEAGSEAAAGAVDREHRVAVDFVEVDVLEHGASQVHKMREATPGLSAVAPDLIGTPLIVLRPLKSKSRSLPLLSPPSLMIWLTVMPRFSQACSCSTAMYAMSLLR